jgi:sugar phosphate isomerase/epimerase
MLTRRSFLTAASVAGLGSAAYGKKKIPVGIEMFSVRNELAKDLNGTVTAVAKLGYQGLEFFSPYMQWTAEKTKEVRKLLDDLKIVCYSTHNGPNSFTTQIDKAIELNTILGSKYIVMASAGKVVGLDGWKKVAETLSQGNEKMKAGGIHAGYHNHQLEFKAIDGALPMEVIAKNTPKDVMLQFDVGTCLESGYDPVTWIKNNPGRIKCIHCKDWSSDKAKGYKVLFGEGDAKWKEIFKAAEKKGGLEYLLIEQEGHALPPFEAAKQCLENFKKIHS